MTNLAHRRATTASLAVFVFLFARIDSQGDPPPAKGKDAPDRVIKDIYPFLRKYCNSCHNAVTPGAERSLTDYQDEKSILRDRDVWVDVVRHVKNKSMPPANHPRQPPASEIEKFTRHVEDLLGKEPLKKR